MIGRDRGKGTGQPQRRLIVARNNVRPGHSIHLVDRKAAQLFYEILDYYLVFEQEFTRRTREILESLDSG